MQIQAKTPEEYISRLPEERKKVISNLREVILKSLPKGFEEVMAYGMIGYVVSHSVYPAGYHADPKQALPFMNIASQKNHIALYHMGIYNNPKLLEWFTQEYLLRTRAKTDMGKSCIRFKNFEKIPYDLIGELTGKITVREWIEMYEASRK